MDDKKLIYLDHAATTPVLPEVVLAMEPYWSASAANPSSIHRCGQNAIAALDDARSRLQKFICADMPREIIFTGSATEANNLALRGVVLNAAIPKAHVLTAAIEHASILEPLKALERAGAAEIEYVALDEAGRVSTSDIVGRVRETTALVSIGYANNEIGTIQPLAEIARAVREKNPKTLVHADAVQAAMFSDMNVKNLGIDLMTFSAHKIYGPKGIGALYIKDGIKLEPIVYGGGQEYGLRAGTENVPLAIGFAEAAERAEKWKRDSNNIESMRVLRDDAFKEIRRVIPDAKLNGSTDHRLPNNLNVFISNVDSETFLVALSEEGICVSSGSACAARSQMLSHVIEAIGGSQNGCHLRITLGIHTTRADINALVRAIKKHLSF